ncbi:MAG: gliding motility-associated C-terminal domain-containing protein [Bacteroidales bacterium]|nr:gliding motility-associated C-terminal domain-containing protein [Bacteroidales bacterium]
MLLFVRKYRGNLYNSSKKILSCAVLLFSFLCLKAQDTTAYFSAFQGQLLNDSVAQLSAPTVSDGYYGYVEKKQSSKGNVWERISELDSMKFEEPFLDTFSYTCKDTITYRLIQRHSTYGNPNEICVSNEIQFIVGDTEIPEMPAIKTATINLNTQKYELSWSMSASEDVEGYVICMGNPCVALDTVWGRETTSYVCSTCDITQANSLAVMAFDTCRNTSLRTDKQTNIVLSARITDCANSAKLSWTEYENMPNGLNTYNVYMKQGSGEYTLLDQTIFNNINVQIPSSSQTTTFYVEAVDNTSTLKSKSNTVSLQPNTADTLDFVIMRSASVNMDNKSVTVIAFVDNSKAIQDFKLYRSKDSEEFSLIKTIPFANQTILEVQDEIGEEILDHIYTYYIEASDICGNTYTRSKNKATTMRVVVEDISFSENKVTWTPFTLWENNGYQVYRYMDGDVENADYVGFTMANIFVDDLSETVSQADKIYYYVTTEEANVGADDRIETSSSSHNYTKRETIFFVPNAFAPKDYNVEINTFKPSCHFVKNGTYEMNIYNRWGTLLFSTHIPEEGWNGKYKEEFCPVGVYIYKIQFVNSMGKIEKHSGTFMLYD